MDPFEKDWKETVMLFLSAIGLRDTHGGSRFEEQKTVAGANPDIYSPEIEPHALGQSCDQRPDRRSSGMPPSGGPV